MVGLMGVKLSATEKIYIPLREFNLVKEDISQLKYIPGTYSHLKEFYQGNADLSGSVDLPVCIPSESGMSYLTRLLQSIHLNVV